MTAAKKERKQQQKGEEKRSMSKEQIKKIVDFAIAQNPLVYRRLADI
jgi:hypothetical protein